MKEFIFGVVVGILLVYLKNKISKHLGIER